MWFQQPPGGEPCGGQEFHSDKWCLPCPKQNALGWVNFDQLLENVFFFFFLFFPLIFKGWDFFPLKRRCETLTCETSWPPCSSWIICHFLFPCIPFPPPTVPILGPSKPDCFFSNEHPSEAQWGFKWRLFIGQRLSPTSCWRRMGQKSISYRWKVPFSTPLTSLDLSDNNVSTSFLDKCCLNALNGALFQVVQTGKCPSVSWISELALYSFFPSLGMLQRW